MKKKCPKCGYVRGENEISQEYECPRCGIVYDKYEAILKKNENGEIGKPSLNSTNLISAETKGIKIQNFIMLIMGSVVISMIMFPPFSVIRTGGIYNFGYAFILNPPNNGYATVNSSMLLVQIIVCVIFGCMSLFIMRKSEKILWGKKAKNPTNVAATKKFPSSNPLLPSSVIQQKVPEPESISPSFGWKFWVKMLLIFAFIKITGVLGGLIIWGLWSLVTYLISKYKESNSTQNPD
jgi:hypothetical protein